ncbi:MAG: hypothetical protein RLY16_2276, partial [Bacteroidota bacterium]
MVVYSETLVQQACMRVPGFLAMQEKFLQQMIIRDKAKSTYKNYIRCLAKMALHFQRLPTEISLQELDEYLFYVKQQYSPFETTWESNFKHTISGLAFLYRMEGMSTYHLHLPPIKKIHRLPTVLNRMEITRLLNRPLKLEHRLIIAVLYDCGLRSSELKNLRLSDIDFDRKMLHIRESKGKKDRYIPFSDFLHSVLQTYIQDRKPITWLLNGRDPANQYKYTARSYSNRGINWMVKRAVEQAGIIKHVNVHTFRHTFATHQLENGVDLLTIRNWLGHSNISTTMVYLQVAQIKPKDSVSLLDLLPNIRLLRPKQLELA